MAEEKENIAIIGGVGLGDNLVQMVLARNLTDAGYDVTVFSNVLKQLETWFPRCGIKPGWAENEPEAELEPFSKILSSGGPPDSLSSNLTAKWFSYEDGFDNRQTMVQQMTSVAQRLFSIPSPTAEAGIQPPPTLQWRRYNKRVVLHPTSAEHSKNWPLDKFFLLAEKLNHRGFEAVFIVSRSELEAWTPQFDGRFPIIGFPNLDECAAFVYESGFFIGNDSGGGHLAACLHIPTLSIHGRKGKSRLWRPDWGLVEVVTPPVNLIGSRLRQSCWKIFLTVGCVERAFQRLVQKSLEPGAMVNPAIGETVSGRG